MLPEADNWLARFAPHLLPAVERAEGYATEDPQSALSKVRVVLEGVTNVLWARVGGSDTDMETTFEKMKELEARGVLPEPVAGPFHRARQLGNRAIHASGRASVVTSADVRRGLGKLREGLRALAVIDGVSTASEGSVSPESGVVAASTDVVARRNMGGHRLRHGAPDFEAHRRDLLKIRERLKQIAVIAEAHHQHDIEDQALDLAESTEMRRFRVSFVGEFKSGKTTLLNALLGQDLLPSATRECTSVVTSVRVCQDRSVPQATATSLDGTTKVVEVERLAQLLTHREQGENATTCIELVLPGVSWFGPDIELVDTPGTHAAGLVREQVTLDWLPNSDAIVFLTRADQLLSASEERTLRDHVAPLNGPALFLVVNHADKVRTPRDRERLGQRLRERMSTLFPGPVPVFWTCAADAIEVWEALAEVNGDAALDDEHFDLLEESGVVELRSALQEFLVEERARAEVDRYNTTTARLAGLLRSRLEVLHRERSLESEARLRKVERAHALVRALDDLRKTLTETTQERFKLVQTRAHQIAEKSAGRAHSKLKGSMSEEQALNIVQREAVRGLAQIREETTREIQSIRSLLATRLSTLVDDATTLDQLVIQQQYDTALECVVRRKAVTRREWVDVEKPKVMRQEDMVGAAVLGVAGLLLFGDLGILAGAAMGALASSKKTEKKRIQRSIKKDLLDVKATAGGLRSALKNRGEGPIRDAEQAVLGAMEETIRAAQRQLELRQNALRVDSQVQGETSAELVASMTKLDELRTPVGRDTP